MNPGRFRNAVIMLLAGITLPVVAGGSSLAAQAPQVGLSPSAQTVKIAADGSDSGSFGVAVDLTADGSTAVVGAIAHNFDRGGAYIFQRAHGLWNKTADLTPSGLQYGDSYGNAVAISADGSLVMVGEVGWQQLTGRVLVLQRTAAGWVVAATLVAPDAGAPFSHFGDSISMDAAGNRAVIGALGVDGFAGRAYVFSRARDGQWTETAELQPQQPAGQLDFGTSVSISRDGSVVLAGANIYSNTTGAAYVFRYHGGRWTQQAMLTARQPQAGAYFGTSVTLDAAGSEAVIGAVYENNGEGAAYIFQRGPGGWAQAARLSQPGAEQFGNAVAVNDGGTIAEVGAEATQTTGTAYVYTKSTAGWSRTMTLKPDVSSQALYGIALAADASGGEVIVGAAFDDNGNPADIDYGAVYVVRV